MAIEAQVALKGYCGSYKTCMYNYGVTALPVSQYIIMAYKGNWSCAD
jgi:hypothetical protein